MSTTFDSITVGNYIQNQIFELFLVSLEGLYSAFFLTNLNFREKHNSLLIRRISRQFEQHLLHWSITSTQSLIATTYTTTARTTNMADQPSEKNTFRSAKRRLPEPRTDQGRHLPRNNDHRNRTITTM